MADKALAPLDMLYRCRTHFAVHAAEYRNREKQAPIWDQEAAHAQAIAYEKFVSEIDATLRDWG